MADTYSILRTDGPDLEAEDIVKITFERDFTCFHDEEGLKLFVRSSTIGRVVRKSKG